MIHHRFPDRRWRRWFLPGVLVLAAGVLAGTASLVRAHELHSARPASGTASGTTSGTAPDRPLNLASKLTPRLQDLLRQEMRAIEQASQQMLSALIAGDDARVAQLARQIHDSFILDQAMTAADKEALEAAAPAGFITRDEAFHELAGSLAESARAGDRHRQQQQFGQMIEACSACHARYATDRFPQLAK
ncbi:MAG: hypothetical protein DYH20_11315 [Gammaproteobacteria bacterium PRO9]|nr:hypothetical protein [Gammaproteobacteria bacterium PRO9]